MMPIATVPATLPQLRIALLGTPVVSWGERGLEISRRQARALLYRLATGAGPVAREQLTFLFWPDLPEQEARRAFTRLLTHLRRALPAPDLVRVADDRVWLDPARVWSDTVAFDHLLATAAPHGRLAALQQASDLYRGPFLAGFSAPDSPEFEAWAAQERQVRERSALEALAVLVEGQTAQGDYGAAIATARRALAIDELAEEFHRRLIALYAASGDRGGALRQFEQCVAALDRELGVAPLPETRAVYEAVRAGQLPLAPSPTPAGERQAGVDTVGQARGSATIALPDPLPALPTPPNPLIGREHDLAAVCARLRQAATRLLTLSGPGGTGKTRLGLQVAAELRADFAAGVAFVPLAPLRDPALVVAAIAQVLGVRASGERPLLASLGAYLREKEFLLVLDNAEHVLAAATDIADLLAAAPRLKVLCTSRAPLRLSGEQLFPVPPLALPDLDQASEVATLAASPAVALLLARVRALDPTFRLTAANGAAIAAICVRLDGLPLALELAAARLRLLAPEALLARLDRRLALLTGGARDLPDRQRTLRATIDWSYALLDVRERLIFGRLAIFAGGWTTDAAEAVCAATGDLAGDPLVALDGLLDHALIQRAAADDAGPRFTMLETIREYALELLTARGEALMTRRAHAAYFLDLAERAEPELRGPDQVAWFDRLAAEWANLRASLAWALDQGEVALGLRLAGALHFFWHVRGLSSEGRDWLRRFLDRSGESEPGNGPAPTLPQRAKALFAAGHLALFQGDYEQARAGLEASAALSRVLGEQQLLCQALTFLLALAGMLEEVNMLPILVAEYQAVAGTLEGKADRAQFLFNMGRGLLLQRGDTAAAQPRLEAALAFYREVGDRWSLAQVAIDLGLCALMAGDLATARARHEEALAHARALRDQTLTALALVNLGEVARCLGDDAQAGRCYAESLDLAERSGARQESARLRHNLGYLALHRGATDEAATLFGQSLTQFRDLGMARGIAEGLAGMAATLVARAADTASLVRAAELWGAAEALHETSGTPIWPADRAEYDRYLPPARAALGVPVFAAAWVTGRALTTDEMLTRTRGVSPGLAI